MSMGVGLRIGSVVSTAVVASNDPGSPDPVVIVRDTVLHMCPDGTAILGGSAPHTIGDTHTVSGFLPRVGDPAGVAVGDGSRYRAEDLVAGAMRCLLRECEPLPDHGGRTGGAPDIMATYPTRWDSAAVAALRDALDYADMSYLSLVSDAEAAAAWFESEIAERPGQLVGIYHVDDTGSTVALIRSGVEAGKAFRFSSGGSPTAQIATALGAFGWLPGNLDAVVVTGDGLIARDSAAVHGFAATIGEKFDVRCVVGPGPEQTSALGAAIRAAGFNPTTHRVTPIGLPPSYDVTEVIDAVVGEPVPSTSTTPNRPAPRTQNPAPAAAVGTSPARASGGTAVATPPEPRAVEQSGDDSDSASRASWLVAAAVGLALVLVAIVFVLFVL
ncbi:MULTISPECIES: hypothetical protein [unclassified Rhodococcus (in: high G+C Gram-positive bacteria)]|uniref:hypothetical protein n=1 Tax=unclassified Rhodococcus (in: high G+C Gram-positive bacteria) TaxID=192944 RepID=UPI000B3C42F7|nr:MULTISPECIES: hypothetical protein [unclassified Rhodococcus (in: high G+C Gram-positive bacteria)]KAF0963383.1 hypothetical protein MLGJGCBP_03446 [Rhodococcus sp. T7]OUS95861.1 hypothetical protein CA951_11760 [Rhodococcus sp. NCIMB 12038]